MNKAMIADVDAKYVVTKETGKAGGFPEKLEAAKENGACLVVIRRPEEDGKKAEEIIAWFRKHL